MFTSIYLGRQWTTSSNSPLASSLESLTFGNNVTEIPENAFAECTGISELCIPSSVTGIGANAFANMPDLQTINSYAAAPPTIDATSFLGSYSTVPVTVPIGHSKYLYKSRNSLWSLFANLGDGDMTSPLDLDGIVYNKMDDNKVEVVRSDNYTELTEVNIPSKIKEITYTPEGEPTETWYDVVSLSEYAFAGFDNITSVTIPESVTVINNDTFNGCTALATVNLHNNITFVGDNAFKDCAVSTPLTFGDALTYIGKNAFAGNTAIPSIKFGKGVNTVIGDYAFKGCSAMTSVKMGDNISNIGKEAFAGITNLTSVTFGKGNNAVINDGAFQGCTQLTKVELGDGYNSIGNYAFQGCQRITSVKIEENVESIGAHAFDGVTLLASLTIAKGAKLKTLGDYAFANCPRINVDLDLPDTLEKIGDYAFYNCRSTKSVSLPDNEKCTVGDFAFANCQALLNVTSKGHITSIGKSAFEQCIVLKSAEILAGEIGERAFAEDVALEKIRFSGDGTVHTDALLNCSALTEAEIDATNIEVISKGCTSLTTLDLSGRVETITANAFREQGTISNVKFGLKLKSIGSQAFQYNKLTTIEFPSSDDPEPTIVLNTRCFANNPVDTIRLGNRVLSVAAGAFPSGLKSVCNLGSSVKKIDSFDYYDKEKTIFPGSLDILNLSRYDTYVVNAVEFEYSPNALSLSGGKSSEYLYLKINEICINRQIKSNYTFFYPSNSTTSSLVFPDADQPFITAVQPLALWGNVFADAYIGSSVKILTFDSTLINRSDGAPAAKNIVMSEGIERIATNWFRKLTQESLVLPSSLASIYGDMRLIDVKNLVIKDSDQPLAIQPSSEPYALNSCVLDLYVGRTLVWDKYDCTFTGVKNAVFGNDGAPINIPQNIFKGNSVLEYAVLSDNVREIGANAFNACTALKVIEFPEHLETLGENVYTGCSGLERIVARSRTPYAGYVGFDGDIEKNVPLYVPDNCDIDYILSDAFTLFFNVGTFTDNVASSIETEEVDELYDPEPEQVINLAEQGNPQRMTLWVEFVEDPELYGYEAPRRAAKAPAAKAAAASEQDKFYWFSPNPEIATVDQNGVVTILKEEPCEIWVYALDGSGKKAVFGINDFIVGDTNRDRVVDISDLNVMIGHISSEEGTITKIKLGDFTKSGEIGVDDLNLLINKISVTEKEKKAKI